MQNLVQLNFMAGQVKLNNSPARPAATTKTLVLDKNKLKISIPRICSMSHLIFIFSLSNKTSIWEIKTHEKSTKSKSLVKDNQVFFPR